MNRIKSMSIGELCMMNHIPWSKVQPLAGIFTDTESGELIMNLDYDTKISRKEWLWFLREWARYI